MDVPYYPPLLLSPGLHSVTLTELEALCVTPFAESDRRPLLWMGLRYVVGKLESHKIEGELWIDGSFLTEKPEPNDVDIVLIVEDSFCETASPLQQEAFDWVEDNLKKMHYCDSRFFRKMEEHHPDYANWEETRRGWLSWFGKSRSGTAKGIAVITIGERNDKGKTYRRTNRRRKPNNLRP